MKVSPRFSKATSATTNVREVNAILTSLGHWSGRPTNQLKDHHHMQRATHHHLTQNHQTGRNSPSFPRAISMANSHWLSNPHQNLFFPNLGPKIFQIRIRRLVVGEEEQVALGKFKRLTTLFNNQPGEGGLHLCWSQNCHFWCSTRTSPGIELLVGNLDVLDIVWSLNDASRGHDNSINCFKREKYPKL